MGTAKIGTGRLTGLRSGKDRKNQILVTKNEILRKMPNLKNPPLNTQVNTNN